MYLWPLLFIIFSAYIEELSSHYEQYNTLSNNLRQALESLEILREKYAFVSNKTNSLHEACEHLLTQQVKTLTNTYSLFSLYFLLLIFSACILYFLYTFFKPFLIICILVINRYLKQGCNFYQSKLTEQGQWSKLVSTTQKWLKRY